MDFSDSFRLVNLGVGAVMIVGAISQFIHPSLIQDFVVGIYLVIFGLATALLEFQIPPQIPRYASFLFSFIGRGIFYIFVGTLLLDGSPWRYAYGIAIAAVGIGYCVLEFIPSIEPPANMRDADGGWGAEQV